MEISKPLENPEDLGNIRKPSADDFKEFYKGDESLECTFRSPFVIVSGDDDRRYIMIAELEPRRKWCYFKLVQLPDDVRDGHFPISPVASIEYDYRNFGYREEKDKVILWFPKEQDPQALSGNDYLKFDMSPTTHHLVVNKIFPTQTRTDIFHLELETKYLGTPIWYNKGNLAYIQDDGRPSIGFEGMVSVKGEMTLRGKKVKLTGYGDVDAVYFREAQPTWGVHDWIYFVSDQLYGVLLHGYDCNYQDGGLVLYNEREKYLIPTDFKIKPVEYEIDYTKYDKKNIIPIKTEVEINTLEGKLEMIGKAIGRYGYHNLFSSASCEEIVYQMKGNFIFNDGKIVKITNGVGWHEVYY